MHITLTFGFFILTLFQGLGSPEQIKSEFAAKLQPYFPNATIVLQPERHLMFGLTCMQGAGPQLAVEAAEQLQNALGKNGVSDIATRMFLAAKGYTTIVVGFDTYVAVFNLQTKRSGSKAVYDAGYTQLYRRECGLGVK